MEKERQEILQFLSSEGYKAAEKITLTSARETLRAIVNIPVTDIESFVNHFTAIGKYQEQVAFRDQFIDRLQELDSLLGKTKPVENQDEDDEHD